MTALSTVAGVFLVLLALRDVFDTLFHPHGRGVVSQAVIRQTWRALRALVRGNHAALSLAGPLAFIAVIAVWGALVLAGFALMFWPHFPDGFATGEGIDRGRRKLRGCPLLLLGQPYEPRLRGHRPNGGSAPVPRTTRDADRPGLLTASISWVLFLYRVLSDYRSLSTRSRCCLRLKGRAGQVWRPSRRRSRLGCSRTSHPKS